MRLFTAILFDDAVRRRVLDAQRLIRQQARSGSFTQPENLHLTLVFLGETDRLEDVRGVMDGLAAEGFRLTLSGLGSFHRPDGHICWMGVDGGNPLRELHSRLSDGLRREGFSVERRPYRPHLTLSRRTTLSDTVDLRQLGKGIAPIGIDVQRVDLMRSDRENGRLVYTSIHQIHLSNP